MALGTKTPNSTEEQDSAFNPAQKIFDERFNNTAAKLKSAEEQSGQIINDNADPTESIQDKEEAPENTSLYSKKNDSKESKKNRISGLLSNARTRGPAMTMISIIFGGGLSISLLMGTPATLFAMIKANITNERNTAAPALHIRSMKAVGTKVTGLKDNASENCKKPTSRLCKASTMSDSQKNSFEKAGMRVDVDPDLKPNGRNVIRSIEIPDSFGNMTKVTTEAELNKALKNNPILRSALYKGFNPRTAFFLDNKFTKMLTDRFKTTKNKVINGDNDAELRKSFRESAGVSGEAGPDGRLKDRTAAAQEKFKGLKAKASSLSSKGGALAFVCGTYDAARALTTGAKLVQITALVQFTMTFLREFDRTIAGDGDADVAAFIGDRLTYSENNKKDSEGNPNRFYNTTAMDAEGMKMIFHGDFIKLSLFAQSYIVGGGFMGTINQWINTAQTLAGFGDKKMGKKAIATLCKAGCTTNLVNAFFCLPGVSALIGILAAPVVEPAMKAILDAAGAMPLDDDTKGVDAGNAIAAGAGLMLGSMAMERGLKPTNKAGMKKYRAATEDIRSEVLALEHYEAKETPFDTTNQYSFLGSIAYSMYQQGSLTTSPIFKLASIFSLVPQSFASITPNSSALRQGFNQELEPYNEAWLSCEDPSILGAQYNATQFCEPTHDMTETAMNVDKTSVINFMTKGKYADEDTGKPTQTEKGKLYAKYIKYCPERTNPIGETDEPVTELPIGVDRAEEGWQTAEYCGNPAPDDGGATQQELDMFSSDTMDISIDDAMEEAAPEATPESDGKWHFPTTVDTPTTSGFGPRGGTNHNGMDLANSIGTPIFAARDGTVVEAGPASGFGNWIVIQHDVDGKRVDTVYGHMATNCVKVSKGQQVTGGQEIGCIGNEGQSTGPHLHFEIWEGGRFSGNPVDPAPTIEPLRGGS